MMEVADVSTTKLSSTIRPGIVIRRTSSAETISLKSPEFEPDDSIHKRNNSCDDLLSTRDSKISGCSSHNHLVKGVNGFENSDNNIRVVTRNVNHTRSLGRNQVQSLTNCRNVDVTLPSGKYLCGKIIHLSSDDEVIDSRVQSTFDHFKGKAWKSSATVSNSTGPTMNELHNAEHKATSGSPSGSPSHRVYSTTAQKSTLNHTKIRSKTPSPEMGRRNNRLESNPFLQHDRQLRMNSNSNQDHLSTSFRAMSSSTSSGKDTVSRSMPSQSFSQSVDTRRKSEGSSSFGGDENTGEPLSIKMRIKMWTEKEREAKEIQEQEKAQRRKSWSNTILHSVADSKQTGSHDDIITASKGSSVTLVSPSDPVYEVIPASFIGRSPPALPPRNTDLHGGSVNGEMLQHEQPNVSPSRVKSRSPKRSKSTPKSSPKNSPKRSSKSKELKESIPEGQTHLSPKQGRSKWLSRLPSPRLGRKKKDVEAEDECIQPVPEGQSQKISERASKKRKAIKRKHSSASSSNHVNEDNVQVGNDDVFDANKAEIEKERANSFTEQQQSKASYRPESQPVDPQDEPAYSVVTHRKLDPSTEKIVVHQHSDDVNTELPTTPSDDTIVPLPSIFKRPIQGRAQKQAFDKTISRDIRDIIDSLGTGEVDDDQVSEAQPPKCTTSTIDELQSVPNGIESSASDPLVNRISEDGIATTTMAMPLQTSSPIAVDFSGDSSSDTEGKGEESSLDHMTEGRSTLKRKASDFVKARCGSATEKERKESVSPTNEAAEGLIATSLMYADAVWDRVALDQDELSFRVGDEVEILDMTDDVWWHGSVGERTGWFPASFVRLRIGQEESEGEEAENDAHEGPPNDDVLTKVDKSRLSAPPEPSHGPAQDEDTFSDTLPKARSLPRQTNLSVRRRMTIRRKDSTPSIPRKLTPSEVRAKVVEEILNTERDYVRNLEDIVDGYLKPCRDHNKLFDNEKIETIFSNVEQIHTFQRDFLRELESHVISDHMEESKIGEVFVQNRHEFPIYSHYCNNHPHAVNEMNTLQQNEQYAFFFESCRLLRNLQDISLEGFLLTPVQKICKYPLQLSELLKYTPEEHPDHSHVVAAQQAMKEVAMLINEQKRRMENIGKIGRWQETIDGWKGDDILQTSTELIHSGELHKISKGHSQERCFFLFDHQLIYCKKEIGGKLTYKGRIDTDDCQVTDLSDGIESHSGNPVKNAWKMNNKSKDNKLYVIFSKTSEVKKEWMEAFKRERERVQEDERKGFHVSMKMKKAAVTLCAATAEARKRRRSFNKKHAVFSESVDGGLRHKIDLSSSSSKKLSASVGGPQGPSANKKRNRKKSQSSSVGLRV